MTSCGPRGRPVCSREMRRGEAGTRGSELLIAAPAQVDPVGRPNIRAFNETVSRPW